MMSGSRAPDPRVAAVSDALGILRLVSDPEGVKKIVASLQQAHDDTVTKLDQAMVRHETAAAELAASKAEVDRREAEIVRRSAELSAMDRSIKGRESALAKAKEQLDTVSAAQTAEALRLADRDTALTARQKQMDEQNTATIRGLDDARARHDGDVAATAAAVKRRQSTLDKREVDLSKRDTDLTGRASALDAREAALIAREQAADALRVEYDGRLGDLRRLAGSR